MKFDGQKIEKARRESGLSQGKLSRKIYRETGEGISPQTLCQWERGICYPNPDRLLILAQSLGKKMEDFFSEPEDSKSKMEEPEKGKKKRK